MTGPASPSTWRRLLLLYLAAIYLTLPLLPVAVNWVRGRHGSRPIALVTPVLTVLAAAWIVRLLARRPPRAPVFLGLAGVALGGAAVLVWLRDNPVEQIHLVEYGLVGFLGWLGRGRVARRGSPAALVWPGAVLGAGFLDEIIQAFLPNRVFDWRDVGVNLVSTLLGMVTAALLAAPPRVSPRGAARPPETPRSSAPGV